MHDRKDKNLLPTLVIENAVRKAVQKTAPASRGELGPRVGEALDSGKRGLHFGSELETEAGALFVIVADRLTQFFLGAGKETDDHRLPIRAKTASALSALTLPAA